MSYRFIPTKSPLPLKPKWFSEGQCTFQRSYSNEEVTVKYRLKRDIISGVTYLVPEIRYVNGFYFTKQELLTLSEIFKDLAECAD